MKNKLLLIALVMLGIASCKKETIEVPVNVPVAEDAKWYLHINGNELDSFRVTYYTSVIPFAMVDYYTVLGGGNNPIVIKMVLGQTYAVKYMDTDSTMKLITHIPTSLDAIHDTVPATVFY